MDGQPGADGQDERRNADATGVQPNSDGQDERERRRSERRERVMARHPRIGWLLLALAGAQAYDESPRGGVHGREREQDGDGTPGGH